MCVTAHKDSTVCRLVWIPEVEEKESLFNAVLCIVGRRPSRYMVYGVWRSIMQVHFCVLCGRLNIYHQFAILDALCFDTDSDLLCYASGSGSAVFRIELIEMC